MSNTKSHLCTVIDKAYLAKCIALYLSLKNSTNNFRLYILCLDSDCYDILSKLKYKNITLYRVDDIRDKNILIAKQNRSLREFAWTSKSFFISELLQHTSIPHIIYTDSDVAFFYDPYEIVKTCGKFSVGITKHNFPDSLIGKEQVVGKYNSGIVYFKNDKNGRKCAYYWKTMCFEHCKYEVTKKGVGDQIYLEDWPKKINKVVTIKHKGVNLAPWSRFTNDLHIDNGKIYVRDNLVVAYHFHGFSLHKDFSATYTFGYKINDNAKSTIYKNYHTLMITAYKVIRSINMTYTFGIESKSILKNFVGKVHTLVSPLYTRFAVSTGYQYKVYKK